jgi:hypothetical protein
MDIKGFLRTHIPLTSRTSETVHESLLVEDLYMPSTRFSCVSRHISVHHAWSEGIHWNLLELRDIGEGLHGATLEVPHVELDGISFAERAAET